MNGQVVFNASQAHMLHVWLRDNVGDADFIITQGSGGDIYVATDLASAHIGLDGEVDEA